ncbi:homocysteine S-methyltransferase family protein [Nocardioides sp. GY 10127]|uniref:homocysteine S-methyltransferase family protein n=1 Tax=Nocardioides sp. GY 10127 TaxID=2569762 RepID=UPI0010A80752|nr:homocysteine S-methyltransferase family protein [Nocardioides sp. GY 10127]TIC86389.1 homocysteine S-methyltransferase [Nocardioides sp. GY 10127]
MSGLLQGTAWVTDAGLETDLIFHRGIDLPEFAAFPLVEEHEGARLLREYYLAFAAIADRADAGLLVETPTWRANPDWGARVGYDAAGLDRVNRLAVRLARGIAEGADLRRALVSGVVGPRGDGYVAAGSDADEAADYHLRQLRSFDAAGADLVHAMTMTAPAEAIGIVRAARSVGLPVAVSFTVETDGRLPDGRTVAEAIDVVDEVAPADWYGLNCAHPLHVLAGLDGGPWQERLTFFRPNASTLSHTELDEADDLDAGDLDLLTGATAAVRDRMPAVRVVGGCCGTDAGHVAALWGVARSGATAGTAG